MKYAPLALLCSAIALPAAADTLLGIEAGVSVWQADFSGMVGDLANPPVALDQLDVESDRNIIAWAHLEHFVPLVPNVKVMFTNVTGEGDSYVTERFSFGALTFDAEVRAISEVDISHLDATFYYELLDNWVTLDLGLTARYFDGFAEIATEVSVPQRFDLQGVIPMLYGHVRFDLPFSGLWIGATANGVGFQGDSFMDVDAALGYEMEFTPFLNAGVKLGYRRLDIKVEELGDFYADMVADGPYLGVSLRF